MQDVANAGVQSTRRRLLLGAAGVLAGCQGIPEFGPKFARINPPAPGKAGLYVYRPSSVGAGVVLMLDIDDDRIGKLYNLSYRYVEVQPGTRAIRLHQISAFGGEVDRLLVYLPVDMAVGQTRFMRFDYHVVSSEYVGGILGFQNKAAPRFLEVGEAQALVELPRLDLAVK